MCIRDSHSRCASVRGAAVFALLTMVLTAALLIQALEPLRASADGTADEADLHFRLGNEAYRAGDFSAALEHYLAQRVLPGTKNLGSDKYPATLLVRYRPGPELLSSIFDALKEGGATVLGIDNQSFEGGQASLLRLGLAGPLSTDLRQEIERIAGVLGFEVQ